MKYIWNRLKEPSSWAGVGVLLNAIGISQEMSGHIITVVAAIAGIIALLARSPNESENGNT